MEQEKFNQFLYELDLEIKNIELMLENSTLDFLETLNYLKQKLEEIEYYYHLYKNSNWFVVEKDNYVFSYLININKLIQRIKNIKKEIVDLYL